MVPNSVLRPDAGAPDLQAGCVHERPLLMRFVKLKPLLLSHRTLHDLHYLLESLHLIISLNFDL